MKYHTKTDLMELPNYIKFGCEIEVQNVDTEKLKKAMQQFPELEGWKVTKDSSVTDNGAEIVSPPLSEQEDNHLYENFNTVLELIKSSPADKSRKVYVNEQCGGHIHFDATMMRKNPEMVESYLRIWTEAEELIYKICNAENNPIRESAVKQTPIEGLRRIFFSGYSEIIKSILKEDGNTALNILHGLKTGVDKSGQRLINCCDCSY